MHPCVSNLLFILSAACVQIDVCSIMFSILANFYQHVWTVFIQNLKLFHQEYVPFSCSILGRNITKMSQRQQRLQQTKKQKSPPGCTRVEPVKLYLKLPALGFLQKQMKSLHKACIPGIMNSFGLMLFKKVYSCIQNTSSSSLGLGTDKKPGAPAGTYRQESI